MRKINYREKGITLVALVITIIILIILAGVALTTALGQNGLFNRAKIAGEEYKKSETDETEKIDKVSNEIDKVIDEVNKPITNLLQPQIKDNIGRKVENNTTMYDENNNAIEVPGGFKVKNPKEDNTIMYDYLKDKTPAVQDGIVIEDDIGNQFVWIPVGTEENAIKDNNEETTEIKLVRRSFDTEGNEINITEDGSSISGYVEEETGGSGYAKNIAGFKTSANDNHGYYIARYEAGNNSGKVTSKQGAIWTGMNQSTASSAARVMYASEEYESDLVNSYAWDTAIVFIQKYSENAKYSIQVSKNTSLSITGERETEDLTDKVCNIYDMASNYYEWSTEHYRPESAMTVRGGLCVGQYSCGGGRNYHSAGITLYKTFRVILYITNKEQV